MSAGEPPPKEACRPPGSRVAFHEGSVGLPAGFEDRTTNLFVPGNPQLQPNLSVARDWMRSEETLPTYVDRQLGLLKSQLASHRLIVRTAAQLGEDALVGERIDSVHKTGKAVVYQRQAAFEVAPARVLVFTASSPRGFGEAFEELWASWLSSYRPANSVTPSTPPPADSTEAAA